MRAFFAAIAAAIASAFSYTWRFCRETGRWILDSAASIGAVPALPIEPPSELEQRAAQGEQVDEHAALVQRVAQDLNTICGFDMDDWDRLSQLERNWLSSLSMRDRFVVASVELPRLTRHLSGLERIDGVLPCSRPAVERRANPMLRDRKAEPDDDFGDLAAQRVVEHTLDDEAAIPGW